ncbi:MAG: protein kinase [Acidobacteria bacterium]|nr:protein kinase [Acidobacteriota bacterium]
MSDRKLLVADYNTRELQRLRKLFTENGYEVVAVQDGKSALDKFFAEKPHVVLLSAMLSKINGFDVCLQIKNSTEGMNTPVILATAVYKGQKYRAKAIHENKASEFIEKPIPDDKLLEIISEFFGDTRQLISRKKGVLMEKEAAPEESTPAEEAAETRVEMAALAESAVPEPEEAPTLESGGDDSLDRRLQEEISATLLITEADVEKTDDSAALDNLLSETLSGLGIDMGQGRPSPPAEKTIEATILEAAKKPDTAELKLDALEKEVAEEVEEEHPGEAAVKKILSSFDTDLERKLSDTLSGVGLSDTSIDRVVDKPHPEDEAIPAAVEGELEAEAAAGAEPAVEPEEIPEEEGVKFGHYLLLDKIGTGGMAELFKAKKRGEEGFQKIVAIKRILPHLSENQELVTMFIDEAKIAAQLSHQNIANIFDFGKIDKSYFISMEYVDGFDLRNILSTAKKKNVPVPHKIAAYIAMQIASALDYAHHKKDFGNKDLNIVHRDVSPQNVLISREGEVKLVDFGISKAESKIHHTVKGALKGKLLYMSPEQAWGKNVDKRSDLYSLGIVLCEMVSGKVLFEDSSEFDVLEKVRSGKMPLLENTMSSIPTNLKAIIDQALKIDIEERYQDGGQIAKRLHDYLNMSRSVPTPKDIRAFLTKLFPENFGLKDTDVINLTFDEFMEEEAPAEATSGSETVLLDAGELEGLEELRGEEFPSVDETIQVAVTEEEELPVGADFQEERPAAEKVGEEVPAEDEEILVAAEVPPMAVEDESDSGPQALEFEEEAVEEADEAVAAPVAAKATPVKETTSVLHARKKKDIGPPPSFATPAPERKSSSKMPLIVAAVAAVAVIVILIFIFLPGTQAPPPQPTSEELAGTPAQLPAETGGQAVPGETPAEGDQVTATPAEEGAPATPTGETITPAETTTQAAAPTAAKPEPPVREEQAPARPEPVREAQAKAQEKPAATPTQPAPKPAEAAVKPVEATPPSPKEPEPKTEAAEPVKTTTETTAAKTETSPKPAASESKPEPKTQPKTEKPASPPAEKEVKADTPAGSGLQMTLPQKSDESKVKEGDIVAEGDAIPPQLLKQVPPRYPDILRRMNLKSCKLICRILISHTGAVEDVVAVTAIPSTAKQVLEPEAQRALKQWKYKPAEKDGVKVKVWKTVTLSFK